MVSSEALVLFKNAIINHSKKPQRRRHDIDTKLLTNKIHCKDRTTFNTLRSFFALPSIRTLDRHNQHLITSPGITSQTSKILERVAQNLEFLSNLCVLSFDETEITPEFRYLPRTDCIDGFVDMGKHGRTDDVATLVLVFGLRGFQGVCLTRQMIRWG